MGIQTIRERFPGACWAASVTLGAGIPAYIACDMLKPTLAYTQEIEEPCQPIVSTIRELDLSSEKLWENYHKASCTPPFDEAYDGGDDTAQKCIPNYHDQEQSLKRILELLDLKEELVLQHMKCSEEHRQEKKPFGVVLDAIRGGKIYTLRSLARVSVKMCLMDEGNIPEYREKALEYLRQADELRALEHPGTGIVFSK